MAPKLLHTILMVFLSFLGLCQTQPTPQKLSISQTAFKEIKLPGSPDFLATDGDKVWVLNTGRIEELSATSKKPLLTVNVPDACGGFVVGFNSVWVTSCRERSVYRIDKTTGKVLAIIPSGVSDLNGEISLAIGDSSVWILSDSTGTLTRIDPMTNKIRARITVLPGSYCAVYGYHSIWVTNTANSTIQRIDPKRNKVIATIRVGSIPRFLTAGEKGIWTLNQKDGTVSRIDPLSNKVTAVIDTHVPGTGGDIAAGNGFVWVRAKGRLLQKINPRSNAVETIYDPVEGSGAVRTSDHYIWVTAHDIETIWVLKK